MVDIAQNTQEKSSELLVQLYELLQGERHMIRIHSHVLQSELCFVNTEKISPEELTRLDCPVYTTRELAYIISLSDEEFRRFHYLKTRLVG
jgi:hypothetical protein